MKAVYNFFYVFVLAILLHSCSSKEYTDAIPNNSTALIAVNATDISSENSPFASIMAPFIDKEAKQLKGINLTENIYLFAAADGNLGVCAPVTDGNSLEDFASRLETIGLLKKPKEQDGNKFYIFKDQWVLGYNDKCLLIMGPVTGSDAQATLMRRMSKLFDKDEEESIKNSILWQNLEELKGNIRMVAQASALPEQMALILTLGAPKGTDASDIILKANMEYKDGTLSLIGNTRSYNTNVEQSLERSTSTYRPLTIDWRKAMNDSTLVGIFMNVKGDDIMPIIQQNKTLNSMLMGTASYEKIKKCDGDIAIRLSPDNEKDGDSDKYKVDVNTTLPKDKKSSDRMVVAINIKALTEPIAESVKPFLGNINTIIYNLKVE